MKTFLIQAIDGHVIHDFSFTLLEAIRYNNWYYNEKIYDYIFTETTDKPSISLDSVVPIGSVEFVLDFLKKYYGIDNIKPINIPPELNKLEYTKRRVINSSQLDEVPYLPSQEVFVKSCDKIKEFTQIIKYKDIPQNGNFIISDVITIDSEWRAFVFEQKLVGLQNYLGDFTLFPDVSLIKDMISQYKSSPPAYTLDVGINEKGTFIIEVHPFFSCGLYGFADYKLLPRMFISTWKELISGKI